MATDTGPQMKRVRTGFHLQANRLRCAVAALMLYGLFPCSHAGAQTTNVASSSLGDLSIEQLVNLEVTSVAKRRTPLNQSPAAVAVLTDEDVRRLGANSIPEVLRAVPGLNVARINANSWAVTSRGFNDQYANKLLVLSDGRTLYTPSFGGVYWSAQDVLLEDLERIEVIRGPGGTLWGANAVNGVINIMSKSARDTQGFLSSTVVGTEERPLTSFRYGGTLGSNLYYRVFGKYFSREGFEDAGGRGVSDEWDNGRGGLRLDWEPSEKDTFTLLGDFFMGGYSEQIEKRALTPALSLKSGVDADMEGHSILGRWSRHLGADSEFKVQAFYDHYDFDHPFGGSTLRPVTDLWSFAHRNNRLGEVRDTWDVDLQHSLPIGERQSLVWGGAYRYTADRVNSHGSEIAVHPASFSQNLYSGFVQDEIALLPDRVKLTLGAKLEHNDLTGLEIQPGGRLLWTPTEHQSIWGSIARAVRTPTRLERDIRANFLVLPGPPPTQVSAFGMRSLEAEEFLAYEVGYRIEPLPALSLDLSLFYNSYEEFVAWKEGAPYFEPNPAPGHIQSPLYYENGMEGSTYGGELLAQWLVTENWRLTGGYSYLGEHFRSNLASPENQFHLRSAYSLTRDLELNASAYFVDAIESDSFMVNRSVRAYTRVDLGLTWRPKTQLELSLWVQNLFDEGHPEFASFKTSTMTEVPRSIWGKVTWRF